jgi:Tfp pilus assembly protein PilF
MVLAISLTKQERFAEAESEFQAAVRLAPKDSFPLCNYAWFLQTTGRDKESLEQYRKALAVNPAETRALARVEAAILKEGGTVDDVIEMYRKAAACPPHHDGTPLASH